MSFGLAFINNGYSDIKWQFLLAFQCIPALIVAIFVKILPDSPHFLAFSGRNNEAHGLLNRLRGQKVSQEEIYSKYHEVSASAQRSKPSSPIQLVKILIGCGGRPGSSLCRRAWLCLFPQIMASWTDITVSDI